MCKKKKNISRFLHINDSFKGRDCKFVCTNYHNLHTCAAGITWTIRPWGQYTLWLKQAAVDNKSTEVRNSSSWLCKLFVTFISGGGKWKKRVTSTWTYLEHRIQPLLIREISRRQWVSSVSEPVLLLLTLGSESTDVWLDECGFQSEGCVCVPALRCLQCTI